jgi:hypothetical protein
MVRLEETGHFVPMDRPDDTVNAIFDFMDHLPVVWKP